MLVFCSGGKQYERNFIESIRCITYHKDGKHHLCNIKCMSPVVIQHGTIVFSHTENPLAQHFVINVKAFDEIKINKHANARFDHLIFVEAKVIES